MRLTGERLAKVLETLHEMNVVACGYSRLASIVFECAAQNEETRRGGAKALGEMVEAIFADGTIGERASVAAALGKVVKVLKKRKKGDVMMEQDDPIVLASGEDHHGEVKITHQKEKELSAISCIESAIKKDGIPPSADELRARLGEDQISRSMVYTIFERVEELTDLKVFEDKRQSKGWRGNSNST